MKINRNASKGALKTRLNSTFWPSFPPHFFHTIIWPLQLLHASLQHHISSPLFALTQSTLMSTKPAMSPTNLTLHFHITLCALAHPPLSCIFIPSTSSLPWSHSTRSCYNQDLIYVYQLLKWIVGWVGITSTLSWMCSTCALKWKCTYIQFQGPRTKWLVDILTNYSL